jgi:hypothetical protein
MEKQDIEFVDTMNSILLHDFEQEIAGLFNGECYLLGNKVKVK